ncbi:MAG: response regulator, partial [Nitrospirae bacterium]
MQSLADALRVFLQREGFQVVLAYDGVEGLRLVTEEKPDLVILDIVLPGEDGLEVCRRIRQEPETARLPILILSGKGEEMDKVVGLEVGADDYLAKPFGDRELVVRVRALL